MDEIRYGYYLRPSAVMCQAQVGIHHLLERLYGLQAAGKFMPHATIKGFFKATVSEDEVIARLDSVAVGRQPFSVYNGGVVSFGETAIVLTIHRLADGTRNAAMQDLHEAAIDALLPVVAPDCDFSRREGIRDRFEGHLTLAMADIPREHVTEVHDLLRDLEPIGPLTFTVDRLHLYAFRSDDWSGRWWETLRWELRRSWRLTE